MQNLFRLPPEINTGNIELRQWDYAQKGLIQSVEKIEKFYQEYPVAVSGSHLLMRLIQNMNISRKLPFDRYIAHCTARALDLARTLKLTSPLSKGQVWDGVFYGAGTNEVIIAHDTLFPIYEAYENWKQLHPITVLQHNQTNLGLLLPDGRVSSTDKGVAIIAINIPMLMAMYYCFNQEQDKIESNGGTRHTVNQFINSYALAGMMRSHLDNVVLNRLFNNVSGVPVTEAIRKHSFFLTDYNAALDVSADTQVEYLSKMTGRFSGVMRATRMPVTGTLWEFGKLPSIPETLQVYWALTLSRMKILAFLCLVQKNSEHINKRELNTIRTLMKMQQTPKVIKNNLGMEAFFDIAHLLDIVGIE